MLKKIIWLVDFELSSTANRKCHEALEPYEGAFSFLRPGQVPSVVYLIYYGNSLSYERAQKNIVSRASVPTVRSKPKIVPYLVLSDDQELPDEDHVFHIGEIAKLFRTILAH